MSSKRTQYQENDNKIVSVEKFLAGALLFGAALVLAVPLVFTPFTIFPFILGKTLLLRTVVELMAPFYIALLFIAPERRPRRSLLLISVGVYLAALLAAAIFGVDFYRSFWSNHERMTGLYTLLHIAAFSLMMTSVCRTADEWRRLFRLSLAISLAVGALGLWQRFHDGFLYGTAGGRVMSTLGNPIYVGGYALFHIFLALDGLFVFRRLYDRAFYALSLALNLIMLFFSESRGAIVAFAAALLLLVFAAILRAPRLRWRLAAATLTGLILAAFLFIRANPQVNWFDDIPVLKRVVNISFEETTAKTRTLNWSIAFNAWKNRPVLGWGPENYYHAFNLHFDPKFLQYSTYESWQDHAHNIVFDVLNESGIIGLAAYVSMLFFAVLFLIRAVRNGAVKESSGFIFGAILLAYVTQNIFVFDVAVSWLLFYLLLGFLHALNQQPRLETVKVSPPKSSGGSVNAIVVLSMAAALILVYFTNLSPFMVSAMSVRAGQTLNKDPKGSVDTLRGALRMFSPYKAESRDEFAKIVVALVRASERIKLPKEEALILLDEASSEYKKNTREHPRDAYYFITLAQWYTTLGSYLGPSYYEQADEALAKARELSPRRQQIFYAIAQLHLTRGFNDKAVESMREAVRLNPLVGESHWRLGIALVAASRTAEADSEFQEAKRLGYGPKTPEEITPALHVFNGVRSLDSIKWLFEMVRANNLEQYFYSDFAVAFYNLGERSKALELAKVAVQLNPQSASQFASLFGEEFKGN